VAYPIIHLGRELLLVLNHHHKDRQTDIIMMAYTERPLFGGAISCEIPTAWRDVSDIRQVPDHQECWQEMDGAVLVVEILQSRQDVTDANAAKFFFDDLADSNDATSNVVSFQAQPPMTTSNNNAQQQIQDTTACTGIGFQKVAMGKDHDIAGNRREDQEVRWMRVELCVFRLPVSAATDLLVTISKPISVNPNEPPQQYDDAAAATAFGEVFRRVVSTLQIRDWGLFG
jgi:hypothetical protein